MTLRFVFAVTGRWDTYLRKAATPMAAAATEAMATIADGAKNEIRADVQNNFKKSPPVARRRGLNFPKAVRADAFPNPKRKKPSFDPAAVVRILAGWAEIFETGGTVAPRPGAVIPLPAARKLKLDYSEIGGGRLGKKSDVEAAALDFGGKHGLASIPARGGFLLGVDRAAAMKKGLKVRRGMNFVPLFYEQLTVRLRKRLDFKATVKKWHGRLAAHYDRLMKRGKSS